MGEHGCLPYHELQLSFFLAPIEALDLETADWRDRRGVGICHRREEQLVWVGISVKARYRIDANCKVGSFVHMPQDAAIVLTYLRQEGGVHGPRLDVIDLQVEVWIATASDSEGKL